MASPSPMPGRVPWCGTTAAGAPLAARAPTAADAPAAADTAAAADAQASVNEDAMPQVMRVYEMAVRAVTALADSLPGAGVAPVGDAATYDTLVEGSTIHHHPPAML